MLLGSVDNNIQSNPYANKADNHQNQAVSAADKTEALKTSGMNLEPHDEYIKGGDQSENPAGVYRMEKDETGRQKIVFDRPEAAEISGQAKDAEAENADLREAAPGSDKGSEKSEKSEGSENSDGKMETQCSVSTDKVDREIKMLKEEKKQIKQQLKTCRNDEDKHEELEKRLSEIDAELNLKDNDAYRKQNAFYTYN